MFLNKTLYSHRASVKYTLNLEPHSVVCPTPSWWKQLKKNKYIKKKKKIKKKKLGGQFLGVCQFIKYMFLLAVFIIVLNLHLGPSMNCGDKGKI